MREYLGVALLIVGGVALLVSFVGRFHWNFKALRATSKGDEGKWDRAVSTERRYGLLTILAIAMIALGAWLLSA